MTVSIDEAVWIVVTAVGLLVTAANLRDAVRDERAVRRSRRGPVVLAMARQAVRTEARHAACLALLLLLGALAASEPQAEAMSDSALIAAVAMFVIAGTMVGGGIDNRLTRHRLMQRGDDDA